MAELLRVFPELELVLITMVMLAVGYGIQAVVARRHEARLQSAADDAQRGPYRAAAQDERSLPLTLGQLPRADQLWTVAWLCAGKDGVVQALMAHAGAAGWLVGSGAGFRVMEPAVLPADPEAAGFWKELGAHVGETLSGPEVHGMARTTAATHDSTLRRQAKAAGLLRSDRDQANLNLVPMIAGLLAEAAFLIRLFTTNVVDMRPGLLVALLVGIIVTSMLLSARSPQSRATKLYLQWLRAEVDSCVAGVGAGRRRQPVDVTLAVAVAGISTLASVPGLGDLASAYELVADRQQAFG